MISQIAKVDLKEGENISFSVSQEYINGLIIHKIKIRNMTNTSTQGNGYSTLADVQQYYPGVLNAIVPSREVNFLRLSTVLTYQNGSSTPVTHCLVFDGSSAVNDTMTAIASSLENVPEDDLSIHLQTIVTED